MAFYRSTGLFIFCAFFICILSIHIICAESSSHDTIITKACNNTSYPHFCISSLCNASADLQANLTQLSVIAVRLSAVEAKQVTHFMENIIKRNPTVLALQDCSDLLMDTRFWLHDCLSELEKLSSDENFMESVSDVQKWLSAIGSYQDSCLSGMKKSNATATLVSKVKENTNVLTVLISDALVIVSILKEQGHI